MDLAAGDPVVCAGVALRPSSVHIEPWVLSRLASPTENRVHAASDLATWEDASILFLLRNSTGCQLFFGGHGGQIPAQVRKLLGSAAPRQFAVVEDGAVRLSGGAALTRKGRRSAVVASGSGLGAARGLRIHNYGRLEVYSGSLCRRGAELAKADAVTPVTFAGPGDVARFRVPSPGEGILVVDVDPALAPGLRVRLGLDDTELEATGALDVRPGDDVVVELRYRGVGPQSVEPRFRFSPKGPVSCRIDMTKADGGKVRARLELTNLTGEPLFITKPWVGSVIWHIGRKFVSAAPGRPPERITLGPREHIGYEAVLDQAPTRVQVDLGTPHGTVACTAR